MPNKEPLTFGIEIVKNNGKPALQFRKVITDPEKIKAVLKQIFHNDGNLMIAQIRFRDKFTAVAKLKEKGLL